MLRTAITCPALVRTLLLLSALPSTLATIVLYGHSSPIPSPLTLPRDQSCPRIADGFTSTSFPWTHAPTCLDAFPSENATTKQTFCVYTSARFAGDRGISFVTTPEVATAYLLESFSHEDQEDRGDEVWEVKEAGKGKGKGVFIKLDWRRVDEGDSVMMKHPVLIVSKEVLHPKAREERHRLLELAVKQLSELTRDRVMGLAKSRGGHELDDLLQTNAMSIGALGGVPHLALLPETARVNHACRPNTFYRFNDYTLTVDLFAVRDIAPGQEVTYSYGFHDQPFDVRNEALFTNWNFRCTCPHCSAPSASVFISDQRLADIASIKESLPSGFENIPQFIAVLPNLIKLLEEESLIVERPMYEEILAYSWSALGIEDRARHWAERARRGWEIVAGKDSQAARRIGELERNVKGHGTWMTWDKDPWDDSVWEEDDHHNHDEHEHDH